MSQATESDPGGNRVQIDKPHDWESMTEETRFEYGTVRCRICRVWALAHDLYIFEYNEMGQRIQDSSCDELIVAGIIDESNNETGFK